MDVEELNQRSHVKRRAEADYHNSGDKANHTDEHGRVRKNGLQKSVSELSDVAEQKEVDESRYSNVVPVENQGEGKQKDIHNDVKESEIKGNHKIKARHK